MPDTNHKSAGTPAKTRFVLDRGVLATSLNAEGDTDRGCALEHFGETPAEQIARAVQHAETAGALTTPDTVDLYVLTATPNAVVLTIRETHDATAPRLDDRRAAGLPIERQIATWHIEPGWLSDGDADTFGEVCETLEEVCRVANDLLPSLQALLDGEARLLALIAEPLTVLTYNIHGRLGEYRSSVDGLTEGDPDTTESLWPLLIGTLEDGAASEDWDGDRQREFRVQPDGRVHLAAQLARTRASLIGEDKIVAGRLPDPDGGLDAYLR